MVGKPVGVILAGGLARRMGGGDKSLIGLAGRPILAHVIDRARPQCADLILNANGDPTRFTAYGLPVAEDVISGHAGPLAGVLTGMEWAKAHTDSAWIVTLAADTPFFPADLVARMQAALASENAELACAASGGRASPVFGLWPVRLAGDLRRAMEEEDIRKVDRWTARYRLAVVDFTATPVDPFFNLNRPDDLAQAENHYRLLNSAHNH